MIVSGFNVYPVEVEEVIREVDGVTEAAVIGVDDEHQGEAVVAYVVGARPRRRVGRVRRARPLRDPAGPVQAARAASRSSASSRSGVTGKVQKGRLRGMERRRALGLLE